MIFFYGLGQKPGDYKDYKLGHFFIRSKFFIDISLKESNTVVKSVRLSQVAWIKMPALQVQNYVTLGKILHLPIPQFHDLSNADNNSPYIIGLLSELNKFLVPIS